MTTAEVENLTAADLKARRDELAKGLATVPAAELAARYVHARTDAKLRDERLAEQAATIKALEQGLAAATEKADRLAAGLKESEAQREALKASVTRQTEERLALEAAHDKKVAELDDTVCKLVAEANGLRDALKEAQALARARRAVLADLSFRIAPFLAAE